jgi:hypothetical protein
MFFFLKYIWIIFFIFYINILKLSKRLQNINSIIFQRKCVSKKIKNKNYPDPK